MATADFELSMTINGEKEELTAIAGVMKRYAEGTDGVYFSFAELTMDGETVDLEALTEEEICEFVEEHDGTAEITAIGPFGHFGELNDVDLFRDMAEAAPDASFEAEITGNTTYTDQSINCVLEEKLLHITSFCVSVDDMYDGYADVVSQALPYETFMSLFRLDSDDFDEDDYSDLLYEVSSEDSSIDNLEYDEMMELLGAPCELTEEEYEQVRETIRSLQIIDYMDYREALDESGETKLTYDPVAKAYVGNRHPVLKSNVVYNMNDMMREYLAKKGQPCDDEALAALSIEEAYAIVAGIFGEGDEAEESDEIDVEGIIDVDDDDEPDEDVEEVFVADETDTETEEIEVEEPVVADETDAEPEVEDVEEVTAAEENQPAAQESPEEPSVEPEKPEEAPEVPAPKPRRRSALKGIGIALLVLLIVALILAGIAFGTGFLTI